MTTSNEQNQRARCKSANQWCQLANGAISAGGTENSSYSSQLTMIKTFYRVTILYNNQVATNSIWMLKELGI